LQLPKVVVDFQKYVVVEFPKVGNEEKGRCG
jgi:hypothetical protein